MVQSAKYMGMVLKNWALIPDTGIYRLALALTQFPVQWLHGLFAQGLSGQRMKLVILLHLVH
jgi:hypothetical protein